MSAMISWVTYPIFNNLTTNVSTYLVWALAGVTVRRHCPMYLFQSFLLNVKMGTRRYVSQGNLWVWGISTRTNSAGRWGLLAADRSFRRSCWTLIFWTIVRSSWWTWWSAIFWVIRQWCSCRAGRSWVGRWVQSYFAEDGLVRWEYGFDDGETGGVGQSGDEEDE